jgi:hypothetical protein
VKRAGILLIPFVLSIDCTGPAEAAEIACPKTLDVTEKAVTPPDGSWQPMSADPARPHHFDRVYFSFGPPTDKVTMNPDKGVADKKHKTDVFTFKQPDSRPLWVSCMYLDTPVVLSRPVTEPHEQCTVTYDPLTGFASVKSVECR